MEDPLAVLAWHWGDAYIIANPEPDTWLAERRDNHEVLRAEGPGQLRDAILADYSAHRIMRPIH